MITQSRNIIFSSTRRNVNSSNTPLPSLALSSTHSSLTFICSRKQLSKCFIILYSRTYTTGNVNRFNRETAIHEEPQPSASSSSTFVKPSLQSEANYPWLKGAVPRNFWSNPANQRAYLVQPSLSQVDWLGRILELKSLEGWYKVSFHDIIKHHGRGLLDRHGNSPAAAITANYSEHTFYPWLFIKASRGFFNHRENRLRYLEWLREKVGVESFSQLETRHFLTHCGVGLLDLYGGSPRAIVESIMTDSDDVSVNNPGRTSYRKEQKKSQRYWASLENQRKFLDEIGAQLGVKDKDLSQWYNVDQKILLELGCGPLLRQNYDMSHYAMLKAVYPEHKWIPWRFKRIPSMVLGDPEVVQECLDFIESEKNLKNLESWYQISNEDLRDLGVYTIIANAGGLCSVLRLYRPGFPWDEELFIGQKQS